MMHIAMFDAINGIEREYDPYYRVRLQPGLGGSAKAAAAKAAHDVLVALNPSAAPVYDAALAADLGARPSGFVRRGTRIGAYVAKEILASRLTRPCGGNDARNSPRSRSRGSAREQ